MKIGDYRKIWIPEKLKKKTILLCAVLFLSVILYTSTVSVFADIREGESVPESVPGYTIYIDGKDIGTLPFLEDWEAVLGNTEETYRSRYGMDVFVENDIRIYKVYLDNADFQDPMDIAEAFAVYADIQVNATQLFIEDQAVGILKDENELQWLLDEIKAIYVPTDDTTELKEVQFTENIDAKRVRVAYEQIEAADMLLEKILAGTAQEQKYTVQQSDSLWSISKGLGLTMQTLLEMNPEVDENAVIRPGQELKIILPNYLLNVETVEVMEYTVKIPFQSETRKDASLYTNQSKVLQEGVKGTARVQDQIIRRNGIEMERTKISEEIVQEPVTRIVAQGTKPLIRNNRIETASRSKGSMQWPASGRVTSPFGMRWGSLHTGIDIANRAGTPIYAVEDGQVIFTAYSGGYGNLVQIDHGDGIVTYYAHLRSWSVKKGQHVKRGELIGYMGSTGNSTGPHLHFEVRIHGKPVNPRNGFLR